MKQLQITKDLIARHGLSDDEYKKIVESRARIIHGYRRETDETEGRRSRSQVRTTQAYSLQYGEEAERERPRRASALAVAVDAS